MSSQGKKKKIKKMIKFIESKTDSEFTAFIAKCNPMEFSTLMKFCHEYGFEDKLSRCTMTGTNSYGG